MPKARKLNLMVASTVYNFEDQLRQVCATLSFRNEPLEANYALR